MTLDVTGTVINANADPTVLFTPKTSLKLDLKNRNISPCLYIAIYQNVLNRNPVS